MRAGVGSAKKKQPMMKTSLCSWCSTFRVHVGLWTHRVRVMTNYLSRGENLSGGCLSQIPIFVNYMENKVQSLYVFLLPLHYFCSPTESGPGCGQAESVCLTRGSAGDALRFPPQPPQRAAGSS